MKKEKILLLGASGSMGFEAFKNLWLKREIYDIVLLQGPSKKNKKIFKPYEKISGSKPIKGSDIVEGDGLKIIWGDGTNYGDILEACNGIDWCLCPMALISPEADRNPDKAKAVNTTSIEYIVKAIEEQPNGADHIKFIYIGTVVAIGGRLPPIHMGRVGDPLKPSIFDFYAVTKIMGERAVLESNIKHWACLRQTFIMIPDVMSLMDPIMFHQPINSFMENNTSRDAGRGLINCLDIPDDSDFWRRVYNMAGGPSCRITFYEFMNKTMEMNGVGKIDDVAERKWFALRNFHMQFYEDSWILNEYIHNWGDNIEDYLDMMYKNRPFYLKLVASLSNKSKRFKRMIQKATYSRLKKMALNKAGTLYWYQKKNDLRISAFFKDYKTYEAIPDWGINMPDLDINQDWITLNHGYDENKSQLELEDLKKAAKFRGGQCTSEIWEGNMYTPLEWKCAYNHEFKARPYSILKAGHWCPNCLPPPWNYDELAKINPFFAQVWYPNHDKNENNFYPEDCYNDIVN